MLGRAFFVAFGFWMVIFTATEMLGKTLEGVRLFR